MLRSASSSPQRAHEHVAVRQRVAGAWPKGAGDHSRIDAKVPVLLDREGDRQDVCSIGSTDLGGANLRKSDTKEPRQRRARRPGFRQSRMSTADQGLQLAG